jgi:hypothetical protein
VNDRLQFLVGRMTLLKFRPRFEVAFARACLDCGTVFPSLGDDERRRLTALANDTPPAPTP